MLVMRSSRHVARLLILMAPLALIHCGGDAPTPAAADLAPTPTKAPTAAPTARPVATPFVCPFGKGTGDGIDCPQTKADKVLFNSVLKAIDHVEASHPDYFRFNPDGSVFVKDLSAYTGAVVDDLNHQGLCAIDNGFEIGVKWNNDFSEQYKIWVASSGTVRRDARMYAATCEPAWF